MATVRDRATAFEHFHRAIHLILQADWDPAGVAGEPYAAQEYGLYVPGIHRLLRHDRPLSEVVAYLARVEEQYLGRGSSRAELETIARKLQGLGVNQLSP
jgi:hypothetical protein